MTNRAMCMGIALIISLIAGSIENTAIIFIGAALVIMAMWFLIDRFVPHA